MPITDDSKLKDGLEAGEFSTSILQFWFERQEFNYIFSTLHGMEKKPNVDIIEYISICSQGLYSLAKKGIYSKPNVKSWGGRDGLIEVMKKNDLCPYTSGCSDEKLLDYWDFMVVRITENFLRLIISIARKYPELCSSIVEPLSMHHSEYVRLIYCCNLDYSKFLNDTSPRVAKVARIRQQFEEKWKSLSDEDSEKQRIMFLTKARENGQISIWDSSVNVDGHDDWIIATLDGPLLSSGRIDDFDKDIVYIIPDKRILADYLNELIKKGKISFKDGMMPDCFRERKR